MRTHVETECNVCGFDITRGRRCWLEICHIQRYSHLSCIWASSIEKISRKFHDSHDRRQTLHVSHEKLKDKCYITRISRANSTRYQNDFIIPVPLENRIQLPCYWKSGIDLSADVETGGHTPSTPWHGPRGDDEPQCRRQYRGLSPPARGHRPRTRSGPLRTVRSTWSIVSPERELPFVRFNAVHIRNCEVLPDPRIFRSKISRIPQTKPGNPGAATRLSPLGLVEGPSDTESPASFEYLHSKYSPSLSHEGFKIAHHRLNVFREE